jgi:hypothetical protein
MFSVPRVLRRSLLMLALAIPPTTPRPATAQAGEHHGVCRNSFEGCGPCDDFLSCYGDVLEGVLLAVALAALIALVWEVAVPAAIIGALPELAEATVATTELADITAVEATAVEATAVEATAAETTVVEATAVEATAVEATAVEATAVEATAAEATVESTAVGATDAAAADDVLVDVAEGEDVIPQEIFNDNPALTDVNPGGFTNNCPATSQAARDILSGGGPVQAGNSGTATMSEVQSAGGSYMNEMSLQETEQQLLAAGDGANGTVGVSPPDNGVGHLFNAVNRGGQVVWFDAQNVTARTTAEVIAKYGGYTTWFMP